MKKDLQSVSTLRNQKEKSKVNPKEAKGKSNKDQSENRDEKVDKINKTKVGYLKKKKQTNLQLH